MINGGKLLLSQIEIIKGIISQISRRPSFIVINGEIGAGKTTICEAIISYFQKKSQKNILGFSGLTADPLQIRNNLIKGFFNCTNFDESEKLSVTCQMFDIARTDGLLIIDSVDCIEDQKFAEELYSFFDEYKDSLHLSIIVSTSRLLSNLLYNDDLDCVVEYTIPHLNVRDKKNLLKYYLEKKFLSQLENQDYLIGLIENCGTLPAEIVKFVENNEMSGMNFNEDDLDNKNNASPETIVPNNEHGERVVKHVIAKPTGPNKTVVIAVAVVLSLVLIGIVSLLLKKQNISNPEEVVVAQQKPVKQIETVIDSASINGHSEQDGEDDALENQMIDNMMSGSNDINIDAPIAKTKDNEGDPKEINVAANDVANDSIQKIEQVENDLKAQVKTAENKIDEQSKALQQKVNDVENNVNAALEQQNNKKESVQNNQPEVAEINKEQKTENNSQPVNDPKAASAEKPKVDADKKELKEKDKLTNKPDAKTVAKTESKPVAKPETKKETAKTEQKVAKNDTKVQSNTSLKVGEVKSFAELSNNKPAANDKPNAAPSAKNFVVQVACSANKADLQAKRSKYGDGAFIYERNNNALKYVLVVGYFATQKDAANAAKKIGNGAFTKSMAAVNKERI